MVMLKETEGTDLLPANTRDAAVASARTASSAPPERERRVSQSVLALLRLPRAFALTAGHLAAYSFARFTTAPGQRDALLGRRLALYLVKMGPLYVKLGQVFSTRSDLLPADVIAALRELQDDCPPSPGSYVRAQFSRIYRRRFDMVFAAFDFAPIASGSIAQVHRARLNTGETVAVKLIKKGVRNQLRADLRIARGILGVLHRIAPTLRCLNLSGQFDELIALLWSQADLSRELRDQEALRTALSGHPFLQVPAPYPSLSTQDVLVMDFVDAIPGSNWDKVALPPRLLAQRLQHGVYEMLLHKGIFHADPHPGNVFLTPEGRIVMVDFGIVGRITEDEKWGLSSFFYACVRKDWDRAVARFLRFFVEDQGASDPRQEQFVGEFSAVLRRHFEVRTRRWSTMGFLNDGRRVLRRYNHRLTTSFAQVAFMFFTGEGYITQIDPEIDVWENARLFTDRASPYMSEEIVERFDRDLWDQHPNSRDLRHRAGASLVAPTHLDRYVLPSRYPLFVERAQGSKLEDVDGNTLVDLSGGYGPHLLGYAHPAIVIAIGAAAARGNINALAHEAEVLLAEDLVGALPGSDRAIFCNSGTEAVLQAIRLARAYRRRDRVAKFEGHYHGFSDQGLVSSWFRFSGPEHRPQPIAPSGVSNGTLRDTLVLQYGDEQSFDLIREYAEELACMICEPMPATLATYDEHFLRQLRSCCDECGVPLIFDEVVSGFRVAFGGVQNRVRVFPDMTCLGKVIGGGLPCGAVVGRADIIEMAKTSGDPFIDYESKTFVGGTMSGNSIVCAAGHAALSYLREHPAVYRDLEEKTDWLVSELLRIAAEAAIPFTVSGTCSILSMRFGDSHARTIRQHQLGSNFKPNLALAYYMRKRNVYLPELHTIMLSAAHSYRDLELVAQAFSESLQEMIQDRFFVF